MYIDIILMMTYHKLPSLLPSELIKSKGGGGVDKVPVPEARGPFGEGKC